MDTLANIGVNVEIDAKTAFILVAVLCSPVVIYFLFNTLTK